MTDSTPRGAIGFRLAHELEGLLSGISADGVIHPEETVRLRTWVAANAQFVDIHPFSELVDHLQRVLADGVLTFAECADLLFVTSKYTRENPHFDAIRGGLQSLMGLLTGVSADRTVNDHEVAALADWLDTWSHLSGLWPYDECNAIVTSMMVTRRLDSGLEHLRALASQFPVAGAHDALELPLTVTGVCAANPAIVFANRTFVFTGESRRAPRAHLAEVVWLRGGSEDAIVTERTDFLVVCDGGSEFWAFSCYGRQVEKAFAMRRGGHPIQIVHEQDFWDALAEQDIRH